MAVAFFLAVRAGRRVLGREGVGDAPAGSALKVDTTGLTPEQAVGSILALTPQGAC
jgi:hypothetical protein